MHKKSTKKAPGKPFVKGDPRAGRPKGVKNKIPASVADMFLNTAEALGGEKALLAWAEQNKNQSQFWTLLAKLMPKTVEATIDDNADLAGKLKSARERLNGGMPELEE